MLRHSCPRIGPPVSVVCLLGGPYACAVHSYHDSLTLQHTEPQCVIEQVVTMGVPT